MEQIHKAVDLLVVKLEEQETV
jgi:hypothetical protein